MTTCAYLGPKGSYTSQAAAHLLPRAHLLPCPTIRAAYRSGAAWAVLPLENTIHGVVQETLGCLLAGTGVGAGVGWRVAGTYDKPIQHALVVQRGREGEVAWVASHEQALGQCAGFLRTRFPHARLVKVPSTAQAAHALHRLTQRDTGTDDAAAIPAELHRLAGAVICSAELGALPGLVVAQKGVQDVQDNFTRFLLLRRRTPDDAPDDDAPDPTSPSTFYRIDHPDALARLLRNPTITLIAVHSKAFPRDSADRDALQPATAVQLQEAYSRMYKKRYLVEVVGDAVPDEAGLVKL